MRMTTFLKIIILVLSQIVPGLYQQISAQSCCLENNWYAFSKTRLKGLGLDPSMLGDQCFGADTEIIVPVPEGSVGKTTVYLNFLALAEDPEITGWSISLALDGEGVFDNVSTAGTSASMEPDGIRSTLSSNECTSIVDLLDNSGQNGVTSVVVLDTMGLISLPRGSWSVLKLEIQATSPQDTQDQVAVLRLLDSLVNNTCGTVANELTIAGENVALCNRDSVSLNLVFRQASDCCGETLGYGFSTSRISSSTPHDELIGIDTGQPDEKCLSHEVEHVVLVDESLVGMTTIYLNEVSQLPLFRIEGWSVSLALDGDAELIQATTSDTSAAPVPDGFFTDGLIVTGIIDPATNGGQRGVTSAVALAFLMPSTLPRVGTESILKMELMARDPQTFEDQVAFLRVQGGLVGNGAPVPNVFSIDAKTEVACNRDTAGLKTVFRRNSACQNPLMYGFSTTRISSAIPFDQIIDVDRTQPGAQCLSDNSEIIVEVLEGRTGEATAYINVISQLQSHASSIYRWGLSLAFDGEPELTVVTTDGTAGAFSPDGILDPATSPTDYCTTLINPAQNGGQRGFISYIIQPPTTPETLPRIGTESLVQLKVRSVNPQSASDQVATIRFQNNFFASTCAGFSFGFNSLWVEGTAMQATNRDVAQLRILFRQAPDNTPAGTNINVDLLADNNGEESTPVSVNFEIVSGEGTTLANRNLCPITAAEPPGYSFVCDPPVCYEISSTASVSGTITICIEYQEFLSSCIADGETALPELFWDSDDNPTTPPVAITTQQDEENHIVCGTIPQLGVVTLAIGSGFHRGDPNNDGRADIADASFLLNFLFLGGPPSSCRNSADINNDGRLDIADTIFMLNFQFSGGQPPPTPGPPPSPCGPDTESPGSSRNLGCESYTHCR